MSAPEDQCLGDKLTDRWWRDREQLLHEVEVHGGAAAAARAHNVKANLLTQAWHTFGLPELPRSKKSAPLEPVDAPERLEQRSIEEELRYYKRRNSELDRALTNREAIVKKIVEAARVQVSTPHYKVARQRKSLPQRSAILPIFDCQFGQLVQPSDTPLGIGEFNLEIFDQRMKRWMDAVTRSMLDYKTSHVINELVIILGGDLVEGEDIFAGQAWQLEVDPAMQTVLFVRRWASGLKDLIQFVKEEIGVRRLMLVAVPGNHGKVGGRKKGATPKTMSWDWLASEWLRDALRAEPIDTFGIEPGGMALFRTAGHLFLTIHGDEVRGWGGIPFYGFTRFDGRAIRLTGVLYDYLLCGHHHQPASIPTGSGGEIIMSGDWVGGNNLSGQLVAASRPQQKLLFVADKYGVTEHIPIYLEESRRPEPHIYESGLAA